MDQQINHAKRAMRCLSEKAGSRYGPLAVATEMRSTALQWIALAICADSSEGIQHMRYEPILTRSIAHRLHRFLLPVQSGATPHRHHTGLSEYRAS